MPERWRVNVDAAACSGSGICVGMAPDVFEMEEESRVSRARTELVDPDEAVLDAALSCPLEAISVVEAASGRPLAPEPDTGP